MNHQRLEWPQIWKGPLPYEQNEASRFFAREDEIRVLLNKLHREKFVMLVAESGAGKTSLLQAGLLPRLRTIAPGRDLSDRDWPCIVIRSWAKVRGDTFGEHIAEKLTIGLDNGNELKKSSLVATLESVVEDRKGVFLVLDQFEEILRTVGPGRRAIVNELARVFEYCDARVRLLISHRQEYAAHLRELESTVGGLYGRSYYLQPMPRERAEEMIRRTVETSAPEHPLSNDAIETLVTLCQLDGESSEPHSGVDLVALQTILQQLWTWAGAPSTTPPFDSGDLVKAFLNQFRSAYPLVDAPAGDSSRTLRRNIIAQWIATTLQKPQCFETVLTSTAAKATLPDFSTVARLPAEHVRDIALRYVCNAAPFLSSGGYKIPLSEDELIYRATRDDIAKLQWTPHPQGMGDFFTTDGHIRQSQKGRPREFSLRHASTRQSGYAMYAASSHRAVAQCLTSGKESLKGLTPVQLSQAIEVAVRVGLLALREAGVLKSYESTTPVWELLHDCLGDPLIDWAEEVRHCWPFCVKSLAALRGEDILISHGWSRGTPRVLAANWLGCWVSQVDCANSQISGLTFWLCNLDGTVFHNCRFIDCRFIGCSLYGTLFMGCELGTPDAPVEFLQCEGGGTGFVPDNRGEKAVQPRIGGVQFVDCKLYQNAFLDVDLRGPLRFVKKSRKSHNAPILDQCHFKGFSAQKDERSVIAIAPSISDDTCMYDQTTRSLRRKRN